MTSNTIKAIAIESIPLVKPGDDLVDLILQSTKEEEMELITGDIIVIASKIVSKSEKV